MTAPLALPHPSTAGDTSSTRTLGMTLLVVSIVLGGSGLAASGLLVVVASVAIAGGGFPTVLIGALAVAAIAATVLMIPAWVLTALWLTSVRRAILTREPGRRTTHGPVAYWVSWLVPIANVVWPVLAIRELHRTVVAPRAQVTIGLWWAGCLAWSVIGQFSTSMWEQQGLGVPPLSVVFVKIATMLVGLVALVQWVRLVRTTTAAVCGPRAV